MRTPHRVLAALLFVCVAALLVGCPSQPMAHDSPEKQQAAARVGAWSRGGGKIQGVNLNDPIRPAATDEAIVVSAAKNEWASFSLQVSGLPAKPPANRKIAYSFRMAAAKHQNAGNSDATIALDHFSAAQILPMPVDVNRAGFVRHTGLSVASRPLPRALLPVAMDNGVINLNAARNPADPTNPSSRAFGGATNATEPLLFWVDLHVPPETPPGEYGMMCELFASDSRTPLASVPVKITIHDFLLPDERHLVMTSRLAWDDLKRLYPEHFETIRPQLIHREKAPYAGAVRTLDALLKLAQRHRTEIAVPRLQPIAKWPHAAPPEVDWADLDSVVGPWLSGEAFADKVPFNHWPLPGVDFLDRFDRASQLQYWTQAASHFDQRGWLDRAPVSLELAVPGRAGTAQALQMSADAAQILGAHPNVRVSMPLEDDQIRLAGANPDDKSFVDPKTTHRLLSASPGIVYAAPLQSWPGTVPPPKHWLRTDVPGLVPYVGAGGDERDVRAWAWLAFLRDAGLIQWNSPLPRTRTPGEHADPNDLVWFYPGSWFGVDEPLATLQLKWLRRAQQDYEYLWLAKQRGQAINAMLMARLIAKPVKIQPGQMPDPTYALLTGTSDPNAWNDAQRLLSKIILLRQAGADKDDPARANELGLEVLRWAEPQEQAVLMSRTADWGFALGGDVLNLRLGVDIYNASDANADQNSMRWGRADAATAPAGWRVAPQPTTVPPLRPYHVDRFTMNAEFDLAKIDAKDRRPAEVTFIDGFSKRTSTLQFVLPVRASDRQRPGLKIDGKLDDWNTADAIHAAAPMVRMLNRPALQKQDLQLAQHASTLYTGWADEHFYVAFKLGGVQTGPVTQTRNFVDYQFRRAWGEDLAEMLIQPIFADNTRGPVLHVVCKPAGHWIERKTNPRASHDPWQPFEGAAIRYTATMSGAGDWNGEIAIPWTAITDKDRGVPKLLRFNFVQHTHATGESASWAGPLDFGRDDSFMGVIYLREGVEPGMAGP